MKFDLVRGRRSGFLNRLARLAKPLLRTEGSTLVEFAVTAPLLLTALTGTCSFALTFYNFQQLSTACSTAVRSVGANQGLTADNDPCALAATQVTGALPTWTTASFTYTLSIYDSTGVRHTAPTGTGSSFSCSTYAQYISSNEPVTLNVVYAYRLLPILAYNRSTLSLSSTHGALAQ
jgi:Flp pilus assembly protein TadG